MVCMVYFPHSLLRADQSQTMALLNPSVTDVTTRHLGAPGFQSSDLSGDWK